MHFSVTMTPNYTNDPLLEAQQVRLSSHLYIMKKGQVLFEIYQKVLEGDLFLTDFVLSKWKYDAYW